MPVQLTDPVPMTEPVSPAATTEPPEPTHGCVRCGTPVSLDVAMCERCNPLGLPEPATSQAHGTVFLGIIVAVIALALLARFAIAGTGPYTASVASVVSSPPSLVVTLTIQNGGSRTGSTTCRVFPASETGIGPNPIIFQSPDVPAGGSLSFSREITTLGSTVQPLKVTCG
jgi:hypothetical protein